MDDIKESTEKYNPNRVRKILIIFNDMLTDMLSNKKLQKIITELLIRGRKLIIYPVFVYTILFCCTKKILD